MTTTTFTPTEFAVFAADLDTAVRLAKAHGYLNGGVPGAGIVHRPLTTARAEDYQLTIDSADSKTTISDNLVAATEATPLTVVTAIQSVTADGVDTVTFDLDGEPDKVVNLKWPGVLEIDKITLTLDGTGDGSFVVGPYAAGACTDADGIKITCEYQDLIAPGTVCTVTVIP